MAGPPQGLPRIEKERLDVLRQNFIGYIAVLSSQKNAEHHAKANTIAVHLKSRPLNLRADLLNHDDPRWIQQAREQNFSHFVFVGFPQPKKKRVLRKTSSLGASPEEEFLERYRKLTDAVVILPIMPNSKAAAGHHGFNRFLHLDYKCDAKWLADAALAVFAAPVPKACEDDCAYWSSEPKLVDVWRGGTPLGLSIMTREMDKESKYLKIVLVKSFNKDCMKELQDRLGKYTHVQSVNGIFLDGLPIERVTDIFKELTHARVQLLVRYIHPLRNKQDLRSPGLRTLNQLPARHSRYNPGRAPRPSRRSFDSTAEPLPIPLFLLGDNYQLLNKLFSLLCSEDPVGTPGITSPNAATSPSLHSSSTPSEAATPGSSESLPLINDQREDVATPLVTVRPKDLSLGAAKRRLHSFKELSESDGCIQRAEVPVSRFEIPNPDLPDLQIESKEEPKTPITHVAPVLNRQYSTRPQIGERQYILHMLKQSVDRQFAHIFLKSSGLYIIAVGLEDIVDDPLIQYENLFFWLRLVHTHVRPDDIKRVIVVGMYQKSETSEYRQSLILQSVKYLNGAIHDMKQNYALPMKEKGFVFMFDLDNTRTDTQYLCACIRSLMEVIIDQAWYLQPLFFETIFLPFELFKQVCAKLAEEAKTKTVMSTEEIKSLYPHTLETPDKYFETLAAYSSACISTSGGDCLLPTSFVPGLLSTCTHKMSHHTYEVFSRSCNSGVLKNLPVISVPLLKYHIEGMKPIDISGQETVFKWLKTHEVVYSIGWKDREEVIFVPFLASEPLAEDAKYHWDFSLEQQFDSPANPLVLYAQLHVPATYQFFHHLVASLLSDMLAHPSPQTSCCINLGCREAILPLQYEDTETQTTRKVYMLTKYHPIQNIIEFRTRSDDRLPFLVAIEDKLKSVYEESKYYKGIDSRESFTNAVSFHIPAEEFDSSTTDSPVWKLGQVGLNIGLADEVDVNDDALLRDKPEDVLLKTKSLRRPYQMTPQLKEWASSHPSMKELPPDLYMQLQKKLSSNDMYWKTVGSELDILTQGDIELLDNTPSDNRSKEVLQRWKDRGKTFNDLIRALEKAGLTTLAQEVKRRCVTA